MSLFSFFSSEFIEVIDWVEPDQDTILWKFPDKENDIKYGAALTVRASQTALFLNEGRMTDIFPPGRYELDTANMPITTKLKNWKRGFNSPFKVDVYFLSTKIFTGLKWGTPNPILLRDPEFKQVRLKAYGTYFIQIKDPAVFFNQFAGTSGHLRIQDVEDKMRDFIPPKFAEALAQAKVSVLDMVANYTQIGDKIKPILQADLGLFGMELVRFQISSTSMPPEVEAFYDKMTTVHMVDDMSKLAQLQSIEAMTKAADNPNSMAGIGAGLGAGMNLSQLMMQNVQAAHQNQPNPIPKTISKDEIMDTLKQLGELKAAGILTEEEFSQKKKDLLAKL